MNDSIKDWEVSEKSGILYWSHSTHAPQVVLGCEYCETGQLIQFFENVLQTFPLGLEVSFFTSRTSKGRDAWFRFALQLDFQFESILRDGSISLANLEAQKKLDFLYYALPFGIFESCGMKVRNLKPHDFQYIKVPAAFWQSPLPGGVYQPGVLWKEVFSFSKFCLQLHQTQENDEESSKILKLPSTLTNEIGFLEIKDEDL